VLGLKSIARFEQRGSQAGPCRVHTCLSTWTPKTSRHPRLVTLVQLLSNEDKREGDMHPWSSCSLQEVSLNKLVAIASTFRVPTRSWNRLIWYSTCADQPCSLPVLINRSKPGYCSYRLNGQCFGLDEQYFVKKLLSVRSNRQWTALVQTTTTTDLLSCNYRTDEDWVTSTGIDLIISPVFLIVTWTTDNKAFSSMELLRRTCITGWVVTVRGRHYRQDPTKVGHPNFQSNSAVHGKI
jgi:hypothetical protein